MRDFTFLGIDNISGNRKLKLLNNFRTKAKATDYAILLGNEVDYEGNGKWWTSSDTNSSVKIISEDGYEDFCGTYKKTVGARPVIPYSSIVIDSKNDKPVENFIDDYVTEVTFGEYPTSVAPKELGSILENDYLNKKLKIAYKSYITSFEADDDELKVEKALEYEYNGEKYIRVMASKLARGSKLSDGSFVEVDKPYWVHVEPITWLVNRNENIAISKNIITSGIKFDTRAGYYGDFETTNINNFLDNYFALEILESKVKENLEYDVKVQKIIDRLWKKIKNMPFKEDYILYLNVFSEDYKSRMKNANDEEKNNITTETINKMLNLENRIDNIIKTKSNLFNVVSFIEDCIYSINYIDDNMTELQSIFSNVKQISNKYLKNNEYAERMINSLNEELHKIHNFMINGQKLEYNNISEFIIYARTKLQDILLSFHNDITNKTYNFDIKKSFKEIKEHDYDNVNGDLLDTYINGINEIYKEITELIPKLKGEESNEATIRLENILTLTNDEKRDINKLDIISKKFKDIYRLYIDIRYYIEYDIKDRINLK